MKTVHMVTGAGGRGFTTLPSGATISSGRMVPWFEGIGNGTMTRKQYMTADNVMAYMAFTLPGTCSLVPVKSMRAASPSTTNVTTMGSGPLPCPSSSMQSSKR